MASGIVNFESGSSVRSEELVAHSKIGIGTHTQTANVHCVADAPVVVVEDKVGNSTQSALRILADGGTTYLQSGVDLSSDSKGDFKFQSMLGATTHMSIDGTNSRVGIATSSPATKLHIVDINPEITLMSAGASSGETSGMRFYGTFANFPSDTGDRRAADIQAGFRNGSSAGAWGHQFMSFHVGRGNTANDHGLNNERMCITGHGRVGVGTDDPVSALHVHTNDSSQAQLTLRNDDATARTGIHIQNAAGENFNIQHVGGAGLGSNAAVIENFSTTNGGIDFYNKGDGKYTFYTTDSNNPRFSILNNGNVGVGDITPSSKLHVDGDVRMKTLSTNAIGEITPVYARGTGSNNNANPNRIVRIGDTTHVNGTGRGLTLTIINASTHAHVSSTNYDTFSSQNASNNLATALEGMTDAQIGILTSHDAFEENMTGNLITACFKLGLTRLAGANYDMLRHPYCAIFYGPGASGVAGNHAIEVLKSDSSSGAYATLSTFLVDDSFMGQTVTNALYSGTGDDTTPTMFVNKDKNVGLGTVWPAAPLDIRSTRNADSWASGKSIFNVLHDNNAGAYYGMSFAVSASQGDGIIQTYNVANGNAQYDLRLQPNGGNVGIGSTNPSCKLEVNGAIQSKSGKTTRVVPVRFNGYNDITIGPGQFLSVGNREPGAGAGYIDSFAHPHVKSSISNHTGETNDFNRFTINFRWAFVGGYSGNVTFRIYRTFYGNGGTYYQEAEFTSGNASPSRGFTTVMSPELTSTNGGDVVGYRIEPRSTNTNATSVRINHIWLELRNA